MFKFLSNKPDDRMKLSRSDSGTDWVVKKGYSILYIGTKEKCRLFMNQAVAY